jgi:hypothetical protein
VATTTPPITTPLARPRIEGSADTKKIEPVVWWAGAGALMLIGIAYIMIRWITGPYFESVDPGVTDVPQAQSTALLLVQILGTAGAVWCLWHFLVKPWRRDGRPTSEGLLALVYGTLYVQDPVSLSNGYWFTYNAEMFNRGSWAPYLPFFNQPAGEPGSMLAEPIFGMGSGYVYFWIIGVAVALKTLAFVKARFPRTGVVGALAASYVSCVVFDIVLEGFIWMKTGFYHYGGAPGPKLFSGATGYPIIEGLLIGFLLTPFALLRYYKDDKGLTVVERGVENLRVGSKTKVALRFLALVAVCQGIYFFCYNVYAVQIGSNQKAWPADVQKRSYFLNGVCGEGTNRMCYGRGVPNPRSDSSYVGLDGKLVVPKGAKLTPTVPVVRGNP